MFYWEAIAANECIRQINAAKAAADAAKSSRLADIEIEKFRARQNDGTTIDGTCEEILPLLAIETSRS
jgi:hypothetical protein